MKRATLVITVLLTVAAVAIVASRPTTPAPPDVAALPRATAQPVPARPSASATRRRVDAQRDLAPGAGRERRRINRTRLLDSTLIQPARTGGVSILAGQARRTPDAPQQMVVTPDPGLTVREIAAAVSRICRGLNDPCRTSDYRFLVQTPTGRVSLPARLIDPEKD